MPMHLLLVNHLKMGPDPNTQREIRKKAGGACKDFLETYEIEMVKKGHLQTADYHGLRLELRCEKNSLGVTKRMLHLSKG